MTLQYLDMQASKFRSFYVCGKTTKPLSMSVDVKVILTLESHREKDKLFFFPPH